MKNIIALAFVLLSFQAFAQKEVPSNIQTVKVFRQTAEIQRSAQTTVIPGNQEIVLTGISTQINPSSLQIQFKNSASELLSAKYEPNYLIEKVNNPKIVALKAAAEEITEEIAWLTDQKNALLGMEEILKKNQVLGAGKVGFTPAQVIELSNNYKKKYLEVKKELSGLSKQEKTLQQKLARTNKQLQEMSAQFDKPSGTIVLQVIAKTSAPLSILCTYTVRNAGWTPLYDLRSDGITEKMKLNYRANVFQNTGQDWSNTKLIVSTGNPAQNNERPVLHPLYARIVVPYAPVVGKAATFSGLNMAQASNDESEKLRDAYQANAQISENQLNIEFEVDNLQSVMSDGKQNIMALKTYQLPTNYIYHTVPKLCDGAFLLAKISDWSQYNLLPGKANIFFEGAFVGTSSINPNITSDTMLISMGRDNSIVVKRNPIKQTTTNNRKEIIGYKIVVRNTKSSPITIEVLDQIPISQTDKLKISLDEKGTATYTENIGKLLWIAEIKPNTSWKDEFVYTIKHPRNEVVAGIK